MQHFLKYICRTNVFVSTLIILNLIGTIWLLSANNNQKTTSLGPNINSSKAFITFTNNDEYSKGAIALAESLLRVKSNYPLIVMITNQVSQDMQTTLSKIGCIVHETSPISLPDQINLEAKRWGPAFTKLLSWNLEQYSNLVFLDADLLVLRNIDELFQPTYDDSLYATVDTDASSCVFKPERLALINSGMLVIRPDKKVFDSFMSILYDREILAEGALNDQIVINRATTWKPLPYPKYGAQITHCECEGDARMWDSQTSVVHFTAGLKELPKPWDPSHRTKDMHKCLRNLYDTWTDLYEAALRRAKEI